MAEYGIDVSRWQGVIKWDKVAQTDKKFAIIKAGGSDAGFYTDPRFEENYHYAKKAGIGIGAYYFVGPLFLSSEDGEADAKRFLEMLKRKKFEYPVYVDVEAPAAGQHRKVTDAAIRFCQVMEDAGYYVGIYASDAAGFRDRMKLDELHAYDKWVASYTRYPMYVQKPFGMWQYSSTGRVDGITGNVDLDIAYYNFPEIIKRKHLNGF